MALRDEIDRIISRRREKIPALRSRYEKVHELYDGIEKVKDLKQEMLENSTRMNITQDVYDKIKAIDTSGFAAEFREFADRYNEIENRFGRDEINIAVVGAARQGKSRLLQSISNLDNKVIPAFEADDCTGTTSIIKNVPGSAVSAEINFMTESQIVECVQKYLNDIFGNSERIGSFSQIGRLDINSLKSKMEKGSPKSAKFEHLRKYVEHFDEWSPMVNRGHITVTDANEIQKYVAQHNGENESSPKRQNYYYYLAVRDVTISCSFRNADAGKVVLRDTIGLGDTSLGIKDKMVAAIREHSDAAIIVRRPEAGTGKLDETDNEIYTTLYESFNCRNNMDKWLFWLVNKTSSSSLYGSNEARCEAFDKKVKDMDWKIAGHYIVDVSDGNAVNDIFSNRILRTLTQNIDDIDAGIMLELNMQLDKLYHEYEKIQNSIADILVVESGKIDKDEFLAQKWRSFYERNLMGALKKLRDELDTKREIECDEFRRTVESILQNAVKMVPAVQDIQNSLLLGGRNRNFEVYATCIDKLRNDFTAMFLGVDEFIFDKQLKMFKEKVVDIFAQDEGGRLKNVVPLDESRKVEWLGDVSEQLFDKNRYSQLKTAFMMLRDFKLTVRGFLMHRIRSRIDRLDFEKDSDMQFIDGSVEDVARYMHKSIEKKCRTVCEEIEDDMRDGFYKDPNRILHAVMAEFYDRINFSYTDNKQVIEEVWRSLYRENCQAVWAEEFQNSMEVTDLYNRWSEVITLLKGYKRDDFNF